MEHAMKLRSSQLAQVAVLMCILAFPAFLGAHAQLQKTEPVNGSVLDSPPREVQLFFNESLDAKVSKLTIKGPAQTKLVGVHVMESKSLMAMIEGDMPDGVYTVDWQTAGDDGHIQKGVLTFSIKRK
jgi:methionine-rich copper-binding protein CopC